MNSSFLSRDGLFTLLAKLYDWGELFWVSDTDEGKARIFKARKEDIQNYRLPRMRGAEPLKSVVFPPKLRVAEYPDGPQKSVQLRAERRVLFGIAPCDLAGIKIFDRVFLEDEEFFDPIYSNRREGLFIVTVDCTEISPNCFCTLVKGKPYAESYFDLNLTPIDDGFLAEVGSLKGEEILKGLVKSGVTEHILKKRDDIRNTIEQSVVEQNRIFKTEKGFISLVTENQEETRSYYHHGSTCVSCGACTHVCPGCFCFGLLDNPISKGKYERFITWDSCQFSGFARMAGMSNPRGRIVQRFMHRYNHKFFHYPFRYQGVPSCVGCGRCIDNCMGRIDMRATLRDLSVSEVSEMMPAPSPDNEISKR